MDAPLVLPFADIADDMLPLVGGKALNLGILTRAGLPVPPGVCVTTEAYGRVAAGAGLGPVLAELAATAPTDTAALARLAQRARALILQADVADDIVAAVADTAAQGPVAVRSSATAEDLPDASFAGQQDTYLNVVGEDAVVDAVRRCWASLWTDRAVAYRAANGIDHAAVRLCVVVQRMVPAAVAGVMFTANPVTGRRHETVIDASPGLGESVVSGAVDPDRFVVDTATGRITERRPGHRTTLIRGLPEGGTEQIDAEAAEDTLTDAQLADLTRLGARTERLYDGAPQDTEWAIDKDGKLWLLQARPVTTLYPAPESDQPGLRVYLSVNVAQGVYRPFTPMGVDAFQLLTRSSRTNPGGRSPTAGSSLGIVEAGGRIYADITDALRSRLGREMLPRALDVAEARSATVIRHLLTDPRLSVRHRRGTLLKTLRALPKSVAGGYKLPLQIAGALIDPGTALRRADRLPATLDALLRLPADASPATRLDHVERLLGSKLFPLVYAIVPDFAAGYLMFGLARLLVTDPTDRAELQNVLRSLPHNVTTEMDLALWQAATRIKADPVAARTLRDTPAAELAALTALPATVQRELDAFMADYGHRAVAEIDLGMPRWSDDPTHILGVLANYLRLDDPDLAPDVLFAKGAEEAERTIEEVTERADPRLAPVLRFALDRTRQLAGLRELPKSTMIRAFAGLRTHLKAVGEHLVEQGVLERPEDIFYVSLEQARAGLRGTDLRPLVTRHREAYDRELRRKHIPRVLLSDGTDAEALGAASAAREVTAEAGGLAGTPASAGTVTGTARVVHEPVGVHLNPGEILVCPSTDPGWTPLFLTAGGLVMEMGGAISHGAVVAREYGIPAVVGVARATELIKDGATITVDGAAGTVTPSATPPAAAPSAPAETA
ncbi:PEP/pyruvate-binding domain-containing protein [Streptomyces boninensis]|uniref:PEP/pyruvate-binding domain-containing protein n=1 Tax=Streptomyces boninensis TaxID=2039455 RepID=UPI003B21FD22